MLTTKLATEKIHRSIPQAWREAAGILKLQKIDPIKYQKQIRAQWNTRLKKLLREMKST